MKPHGVRKPEAPASPGGRQPRDRRALWGPPAIALLLFLLALSALLLWLPLPNASNAGRTGQGGTGNGLTASDGGQGNTNHGDQTGMTDHGSAHADAHTGDDANRQPDDAGGSPTPPTQPSATQAQANAADPTAAPASAPANAPATDRTATPTIALPELGFASDLSALPTEVEPPATTTTDASAAFSDTAGNGNGAAGQAGLASFFGQTGQGSRFVFVLDKSGSMSGKAFADARFELIRSLRSLQPHESFYVIFYDNDAEPMPAPGLVSATPQNVDRYVKWVRQVSTGGGTDPTSAMTQALGRLRPDTIWLLSDGAFSVAVAETITRLNPQRRVHINTIAFKNRSGEAILKIIADENRGDYRFVGNP